MTCTIVTPNQKGGVGKTTTAVSLAHGLALRGRRVLLVDFDPQGQCATALGLQQEPGTFNVLVNPSADMRQWIRNTGREGLELLPGNRATATAQIVLNAENRPVDAIEQLFKPYAPDYDFMIFDTAPSVGGIQERAIFASNQILIPTATEFLSMEGLSQIVATIGSLQDAHAWPGTLAGILPTFYDEQTTESKQSMAQLTKTFNNSVLNPIHRATVLRECAAEGLTIFEKAPSSRASTEYETLTGEIIHQS